ncbi:MAG: 16S rRNA (adenine(1518)-N(6)/adenine(1519)-N(6))-dimethyltransferase RsmA, partial [Chitinophagales bacterium]|nr:16S rRNA (adenine(1518)-N(6)/adenine(1519)-N(6))-dimethyltransferase RsmA [Chitinophagales bacterium]
MLRAKKSLGQHFLKDENIAKKIVEEFLKKANAAAILEIGPGMGMLTKYLLKQEGKTFYAVDTDSRMINFVKEKFSFPEGNIFHDDFLKFDLAALKEESIAVIGNFPYNISTQILFKILENKNRIPMMVGMFQKEVAQRIASGEGNKNYGILSVLLQAFYKVEYLFEVGEKCFAPPPKVKSAVIRIVRLESPEKVEDEKFFFALVKSGFNQRRKTLRNSL